MTRPLAIGLARIAAPIAGIAAGSVASSIVFNDLVETLADAPGGLWHDAQAGNVSQVVIAGFYVSLIVTTSVLLPWSRRRRLLIGAAICAVVGWVICAALSLAWIFGAGAGAGALAVGSGAVLPLLASFFAEVHSQNPSSTGPPDYC